jgi:hypothetical protein
LRYSIHNLHVSQFASFHNNTFLPNRNAITLQYFVWNTLRQFSSCTILTDYNQPHARQLPSPPSSAAAEARSVSNRVLRRQSRVKEKASKRASGRTENTFSCHRRWACIVWNVWMEIPAFLTTVD